MVQTSPVVCPTRSTPLMVTQLGSPSTGIKDARLDPMLKIELVDGHFTLQGGWIFSFLNLLLLPLFRILHALVN